MSDAFNTSDVSKLALDLTTSPVKLQIAALKVLEGSAERIEQGMREDATGHRALADLPNHVSSERMSLGLEYEIGFDKVGQGNLANVAAFGTSKNAPVMDHAASLRREEPVVLAELLLAAEKSVG